MKYHHILYKIIFNVVRPILFQIPPETAHHIISSIFHRTPLLLPRIDLPYYIQHKKVLQQTFYNKSFLHPIGLGAGFDKYGILFSSLLKLGFSFIELGSFTKKEQLGNPKPRIWRFSKEKSLINNMGFNNPGIHTGLKNISFHLNKKELAQGHNISLSIGKSKDTPIDKANQDYVICLSEIERWLSKIDSSLVKKIQYIAINISSPNTPNLRDLQASNKLRSLLEIIKKHTALPLFVKLAPDFDNTGVLRATVNTILEANINGIIISNTSNNEGYKKKLNTSLLHGGVSGSYLTAKARVMLSEVYNICHSSNHTSTLIIASGGIMNPHEVWVRLLLGANLIQLYTGFIFYGPHLVYDSLVYILKKFKEYSVENIETFYSIRKEIYKYEYMKDNI